MARRPCLVTKQIAVLLSRRKIPCRRQPDGSGHGSGLTLVDVLSGDADTSRAVCHGQRWDARPRDRRVVESIWGGKLSMHHLDLLIQRHLCQQEIGPLMRGQRGVDPGRVLCGGW